MCSPHSHHPLAVTGSSAHPGCPRAPPAPGLSQGPPALPPHSPQAGRAGVPRTEGLFPRRFCGSLALGMFHSARRNSPCSGAPREGKRSARGARWAGGALPGTAEPTRAAAAKASRGRLCPGARRVRLPHTGACGTPGSGAIAAPGQADRAPAGPGAPEQRGAGRTRRVPGSETPVGRGTRGRPGREGLRAAGAPPARRPGLSGSRDLCGGFTGKVAAGGGGAAAASQAGSGAPAGTTRPPGSGSGPRRAPTETPRGSPRLPHRTRPRQPWDCVRRGSVPGRSSAAVCHSSGRVTGAGTRECGEWGPEPTRLSLEPALPALPGIALPFSAAGNCSAPWLRSLEGDGRQLPRPEWDRGPPERAAPVPPHWEEPKGQTRVSTTGSVDGVAAGLRQSDRKTPRAHGEHVTVTARS